MPFITADKQPQGHVGRTYYQVTYRPDGSGWSAFVEDVRAGETEVAEADWLALRVQNLEATHTAELVQAEAVRTQRTAEAKSKAPVEYAAYAAGIEQANAAQPEELDDAPLQQPVWLARRQREQRTAESVLRQDVLDIKARIDREAAGGVNLPVLKG